MNEIPSLTALVERVRKGDAEAVGLIETHYEAVLVKAVRESLNPDNPLRSVYLTDDIKQTVYRRILDMAARARTNGAVTKKPIDSGSSFLGRIVSNRVSDHGRRQLVSPDESVVAVAPDPTPGPDVQVELRDLVQKVLAQLSPAHREIAIRRGQGETYPEIAPEDQEKVAREFLRATRALTNPAAGD